ncbi:MAG: hypothetical protein J0H98_04035 [Solirubrobacterales bacterium]|nr:hypothetical protein [Solirubrobacterales bacterium]
MSGASGLLFKRLLLAFWTMFFSMVALTNFVDLMGEFSVFHWTFLNSGNFDYMREIVKVYEISAGLTKLLLLGAFLIELIGAVLFWRALLSFGRQPVGRGHAFQALCWGTFVWLSFVFMTEFFVAYGGESVFRELLTIMIGTGLALVLVPDSAGTEPGEPT